MVEVNGASQNVRYENLWWKRWQVMAKVRVDARQDGRMADGRTNTLHDTDPIDNELINNGALVLTLQAAGR